MAPQLSLSFIVSHKSKQYPISLLPTESLATLQAHLEELTSVPPSLQKLLIKGKKADGSSERSLEEVGITNGTKVLLLGSTGKEVDSLKAAEAEMHRRDEILERRLASGPTRVRSTATPSKASSQFIFHRLEPLPHLPSPHLALALLKKLAADRAIAHIMRTHRFSIGLLTEFAPHEHPRVLGLNINMGQVIKLRLRTDAYDGFRNYRNIRQVLCHELTHCVWGEHDDNFKKLNSQLNREVAEFERAEKEGSHTLGGPQDVYQPVLEEPGLEAEAHSRLISGAHVLGGRGPADRSSESREERRQRLLEATINRLRQEEQSIEDMCGSSMSFATKEQGTSDTT